MSTISTTECLSKESKPQETKVAASNPKPKVCVFIPLVDLNDYEIKSIFGDMFNLFEIIYFKKGSFSRADISEGSLGQNLKPEDIIALSPVLVISELIIEPMIPDDPRYGIKMLLNLFGKEEMDDTELVVISKERALESLVESHLGFRVRHWTSWERIRKSNDELEIFRDMVREIIIESIPDRPNLN